MTDFLQQMQPVLQADQGILDAFGMHVDTLVEGRCEFSAQVPETLVNARGFAHGAISFALMDTAAAYVLRTVEAGGVTTNANVTYVRGAGAGDALRGEVTVMHAGQRTASVRGQVEVQVKGTWKLAAHGVFSFQVLQTD